MSLVGRSAGLLDHISRALASLAFCYHSLQVYRDSSTSSYTAPVKDDEERYTPGRQLEERYLA